MLVTRFARRISYEMRMYQGPLPLHGRLPARPRRRTSSYRGLERGHHPPLAWLPPLAKTPVSSTLPYASQSPTTITTNPLPMSPQVRHDSNNDVHKYKCTVNINNNPAESQCCCISCSEQTENPPILHHKGNAIQIDPYRHNLSPTLHRSPNQHVIKSPSPQHRDRPYDLRASNTSTQCLLPLLGIEPLQIIAAGSVRLTQKHFFVQSFCIHL